MSDLISLSDEAFDKAIGEASNPVLVDFWAPWCQPCKALTPILEEIAQEYQGKVTIYKMNVDDHKEAATKFGVRGIPTLIIFKEGEAVATKVGSLTKSQLASFIDSNLQG